MLVGFNNLGFDHLEAAKPYVADGVAGLARAAHDLGFRAFQLSTRRPQDPGWFATMDVEALRTKLEELDVQIHLHHHAIDLLSLYHFAERDEYYETFEEYVKAAARFIHELGGDLVTFHPPQVNIHKWIDGVWEDRETCDKATQAFDEMVRRLGDFADGLGIKLAMEAICFAPPFIGGTIFRGEDALDEFVRAPGFPESVGLQIDTTHFHHKGRDVCEVIRKWSNKLFDMHVSDSIMHEWIDDQNYKDRMLAEVHLPVGQGTTDFEAVTRTLKEIGYGGWLTHELYPQHVKSFDDITHSREVLEGYCGVSD